MEEKRIENSGEKHICGQCGATFEGNFCHACGAAAQEKLTFCPVCGFDRVEDAPFCNNCGFSFVIREAEPAPQAPVAPVAQAVGMDLHAMSQLEDMYIQPERYSSELDFKYSIAKKSGKVTISKYIGNDQVVCVPPTIEGKPVVKIGEKAFGENTLIKKVVLPEGLVTLADWVFFCCTNLESISFPSTLEKVGLSQCTDCGNLREIIVAKGNKVFYSGCNALVQQKDKVMLLGARDSYGVSEIGSCAFVGRFGLTEITIPETVKKLCYEAFCGCKNLTRVNLTGNTVEWEGRVFENCTSLTHFVIPEGTKRIGGAAFDGCKNLEYVVFPDSLVELTGSSFSKCPRLKTFYCSSKHIMRNWHPMWNKDCKAKISTDTPPCFAVPAPERKEKPKKTPKVKPPKKEKTGGNLSIDKKKLFLIIAVMVALAALVIGGIVFARSSFGVQVENGVTTLHIYKNMAINMGDTPLWKQFYPDLEPQHVWVREGVTKIESYVFEEDSIVSITIPSTVTQVDRFAFSGCGRLWEIKNESNVDISEQALEVRRIYREGPSRISLLDDGHIIYEEDGEKTVISYLGDARVLEIPEGVTSIGKNAYRQCHSFDSIRFPESLTTIGSNAFGGCQGLIAVNIPDTVTSIGENAFGACGLLEVVSFHCETVGDNAFLNCRRLGTVMVGDNVKRIGLNAFWGCANLEDFQVNTTGWKIYSYGAYERNGEAVDLKNDFALMNSDWQGFYLKRD